MYQVSGHVHSRVYFQCDNNDVTRHPTVEKEPPGYEVFPPDHHRIATATRTEAAEMFVERELTDPSTGRCRSAVFGHQALDRLTNLKDEDHIEDGLYTLIFVTLLDPSEHRDMVMACCGGPPTTVWGEAFLDVSCPSGT